MLYEADSCTANNHWHCCEKDWTKTAAAPAVHISQSTNSFPTKLNCVRKKVAPTTFVNNNFKSKPIVKIFYTQNQQNFTEIILYFCLIITFRFLLLASCLLTVQRYHRSFAADASRLWVANVCWELCKQSLCIIPFSRRNIFYLSSVNVIFANSLRFFCKQNWTLHRRKLSVCNLDDRLNFRFPLL